MRRIAERRASKMPWQRWALGGVFLFLLGAVSLAASPMHWPTPYAGPKTEAAASEWAQPTVSGEVPSALFGCVRNNGNRFHEGLDITPVQRRDRRGEAVDPITAAWSGRVVHLSPLAGLSSYGRYVVLEHSQFSPSIYSLYAHLASIEAKLEVGMMVESGEQIGIMGRSAGGYSIPRERAHLHFEVGLRLTDNFQAWFDRQRFGSQNDHGIYNGMNLLGLDPLDCYQWLHAQPGRTFTEYFPTIPPGVIFEVATSVVPDLARRNPGLVPGGRVPAGVRAWRVTLSGWGLPLSLEPLTSVPEGMARGDVRVAAIDPGLLDRYGCRNIVERSGDVAVLGSGGRQLLELLFNLQ